MAGLPLHRSYQDHSPIQIVRYSNRIEILNPGFSLKDMASLGTPGPRMRDRGLLEKQGAGNRTHYTLFDSNAATRAASLQGELSLDGGKQTPEGGKQAPDGGKRDLPPLPAELRQRLPKPGARMAAITLRQLIQDLCGWRALRADELATLLGKDLQYLRNRHLSVMVQAGALVFRYPASPHHQRQAYQLPRTP